MSRILVVVPPFPGHILPTVALGEELSARGHQVAWFGHEPVVRPLLAPGAAIVPILDDGTGDWLAEVRAKALSRGRGAAAFQFLWQDVLIPLAHSMAHFLECRIDQLRPDLLIVDQQAFVGGMVARRRGMPWVTSATTSAEFAGPVAALPQLDAWAKDQLDELQRWYEIPQDRIALSDLRFSEHLVLAYTTEAFVDPKAAFPDHYAFVGPSLGARAQAPDYPWAWLDSSREHVLVSLGTLNREISGQFLRTVTEAVEPLGDRIQVTLVAPPGLVEDVPAHVLVREFVPQLDLLGRTAAVICHGGHNTVCESLAHGLPLVVAPIRDDQPIIAEQVVAAEAGIRVRFGRVSPDQLREALTAVLDEPRYRLGAQRIQRSFAAAGGAEAAANHVEKLL